MKFLASLFKPQCKDVNHLVSDGIRCVLNQGHDDELHFARLGKTETRSW